MAGYPRPGQPGYRPKSIPGVSPDRRDPRSAGRRATIKRNPPRVASRSPDRNIYTSSENKRDAGGHTQDEAAAITGESFDPGMAMPGVPQWVQNYINRLIKNQMGLLNSSQSLPKQPDFLEPEKYSDAIAGQQYDSTIAAIQNQLGRVGPQSEQAQADIGGWFDQTTNTFNQGQAQLGQEYQNQLGGLQSASEGLIGALGGGANPGAAGIAQAALQAQGGLRGQQFADQSFAANMRPTIGLQRSQELINEQRRSARLAADLADELAGAKKEKGFAKSKAYQEASLLGSQFDQQRFENQLSQLGAKSQLGLGLSNLLLGAGSLPLDVAGKQSALLTDQTQRQRLSAEIQAIQSESGGRVDMRDPKQLDTVMSAIQGSIAGPGGNFTTNPSKAWNNVVTVLKQYKIYNPTTIKLAQNLMRQIMQKSHASNMWKQWTIGPGGYPSKK